MKAVARHFEKRGAQRLFRRFATHGSTLELAIGKGGEDEDRVSVPCRSAAAATRLAGTWARWALDAGYAEVDLPAGLLGVVATVVAPGGPGRIRLDRRDDVQFLATPAAVALDVGDRVVVTGVHRVPSLRASWMFGSKLRARGVVRFPEPRWRAFVAKSEPGAAIRRALERLAGPAILGHVERPRPFPRHLRCGALIFSYEKGVHRFLRLDRYRRGGDYVLSEPVLTSNFRRQSGPPSSGVSTFSEPVPTRLAREIARRYGF